MLKETNTQGMKSGGSSNFSTPQSHAIKDGSSFISKGWCILGAWSSGFCTLSQNKYFKHSVMILKRHQSLSVQNNILQFIVYKSLCFIEIKHGYCLKTTLIHYGRKS